MGFEHHHFRHWNKSSTKSNKKEADGSSETKISSLSWALPNQASSCGDGPSQDLSPLEAKTKVTSEEHIADELKKLVSK